MTNFKQFIKSMSPKELELFAKSCGTSVGYIQTQLLGAYRKPGTKLWHAIVDKSNGSLTDQDMLDHFMPRKESA